MVWFQFEGQQACGPDRTDVSIWVHKQEKAGVSVKKANQSFCSTQACSWLEEAPHSRESNLLSLLIQC